MGGVGCLLSTNQRDQSTVVEVDGKSLRLTHLSKVMFPEDGHQGGTAYLLPDRNALPPGLIENYVCK